MTMAGAVWVLGEQWRGALADITYELLALGRPVADGLGVPLEVVLLGSGVDHRAGPVRGGAGELLHRPEDAGRWPGGAVPHLRREDGGAGGARGQDRGGGRAARVA